MATYYKYAERQADSFVNWGEIGKNLSEMLQTENQLREDKKAEIDKASREFGEQLANSPTGEHQGANAWTLNYASDAQQARLLQDRLLKSGQLKLKDYTIMRQNINDGTKQVFNLAKEYQEEYKVKMERAKSQDPATASQMLEGFAMGSIEGFANFNKSKILINPTDFQVSVGMMEPDPDNQGVMKLTDNVETVNALRNRIKAKFDKFDTQKATKEISGRMAEYITADIKRGSDTRAGQVVTLEDAMQRPGYKKSVENAINSYFTNPYNQLSVLTEDIGTDENGVPFQFTFDEKEAKGKSNMIFLERDPQSGLPKGILTEKQKQATVDFMRGQIEQQIARKEEIRTFSEPQKQELKTEVSPRFTDPSEMYVNHINSIITPEIVTGNEDTARANISKAVANLGFSVEIPTRPGRDIIVIKNKDGVRSSEINLKDGAAALKEVRGFLLSNVPGANFEAQQMYLFGLRNQGIIGSRDVQSRIGNY
jgi:hypothetical protein